VSGCIGRRGPRAKKPARPPGLSPLQDRADDLLARLKKKPTRGDVVAAIQRAVMETMEHLSAEMCVDCRCDGGSGQGKVHGHGNDTWECNAADLWISWRRVQAQLWGER
jgi:hypothetical protein